MNLITMDRHKIGAATSAPSTAVLLQVTVVQELKCGRALARAELGCSRRSEVVLALTVAASACDERVHGFFTGGSDRFFSENAVVVGSGVR